MPRLPDLSKMSDDEYKRLSPEQLAQYNKQLPEHDYEHPYNPSEHPFPRHVFAIVEANGAKRMRSATVNDDKDYQRMKKAGWKDNPIDLGVETCPGAPAMQTDDLDIALELPEEAKVVAAGA
jgi:hypothetical protein